MDYNTFQRVLGVEVTRRQNLQRKLEELQMEFNSLARKNAKLQRELNMERKTFNYEVMNLQRQLTTLQSENDKLKTENLELKKWLN